MGSNDTLCAGCLSFILVNLSLEVTNCDLVGWRIVYSRISFEARQNPDLSVTMTTDSNLFDCYIWSADVIWRKGKGGGELVLQGKLPAEAVNIRGGGVPELFIKHANVFVSKFVFVENQAFANQGGGSTLLTTGRFVGKPGEEFFGGH